MFLAFSSEAQNWPEDRLTAEEKVALYSDFVRIGEYRKAADNMYWLLVNAPDLMVGLYQNGTKIYENLAANESDPAQKNVYFDSLMWLYDSRMKYFNDSVNVMNRKAYTAYKFKINDQESYEMLLELFDETFRISGNNVLNSNLPAYMNVVKVNRLVTEKLTLEDVFDRYNTISGVVDHKIQNGSDLSRQKDLIDRILTETIPEGIDCDFVVSNLGPKFEEDPDDLVLTKRIFSAMLNGKCTDDPLFMQTAKAIQEREPTYSMAHKVIGKKCLAKKDFSCAEGYFTQAIELAHNPEERAEVHVDLGTLYSLREDNLRARENYRKAIQLSPGNKEAFNGIGNLYYYGASDCAELEDVVEDRLPYLAAYDMYQKAGNQKMMDAAHAQFPSKEEIFTQTYEQGQTFVVGCWIKETVSLRTRD